MEIKKFSLQKFLYGLLFILIIPLLLTFWSLAAEKNIPLPIPYNPEIASIILLAGLTLIILGIYSLMKYGQGLPMNAFPPLQFVTQGIFKLLKHPIYTGFIFICIGGFILLKSSSGFWLVTPTVLLGCTALVQGYEKNDLQNRFGKFSYDSFLRLPEDKDTLPKLSDRFSIYVLVLIPSLILYRMVQFLGIPKDAISTYLPFEKKFPVIEFTEIFYISTYLFVTIAPLIAKTNSNLRKFAINGLYSTIIITIIFLVLPSISQQKEFIITNKFGELLTWERQFDSGVGALPAFHVVWTLLAARLYARNSLTSKVIWYAWALLISISCITTGMHSILDVIAGFLFVWFINNISKIWHSILQIAEKIANSWKEFDYGWIRIINHGGYAGIGTFIGLSIIGMLIGQEHLGWIFFIAISGMILSALWAQFIEGSPALLRPYGYYGGVLGVIISSFIAALFGENVWLFLAAFCVAGPWIQSFGRLRCLVQGCCHGRETSEEIGIKYFHPRSRVTRLSNLKGIPIHPTPVYSIMWNIFIAIVMLKLWFLNAQLPLIAGLYLILTGLGRFVEESFRGEPQTPIYWGLRLYQWVAIASIIIGAVMTTFYNEPAPTKIDFAINIFLIAMIFGIFTWFGLGVDFPKSNKRFARLV